MILTLLVTLALVSPQADAVSCTGKWCSFEYKYQKKSCRWRWGGIFPSFSCSWSDTDYKWCVHKWGSSPSSSYGEAEFWDDDRIVRVGNGKSSSGTGAQCKHRSDIGNCKQETVQIDLSEAYRC